MTISGDSFRAQPPPLKPTSPNLRPAPLGRRPAPTRNRTPQTPVKEHTTNTVAKEAFSKEVHTASDPPTLNRGNTLSDNVPKQHTFTPIQTQISDLHDVRDAHLQAITRLDAQIAKTETLAARIFQFPSTRKRLKQEIQTQKEIRDLHAGELQEVEKQTASAVAVLMKNISSMSQGWQLSETQDSTKDTSPLSMKTTPLSTKQLFVKVAAYLDPISTENPSDQQTDKDFGTVLKDFARGAQRLKIEDGRSNSLGTVIFDAEEEIKKDYKEELKKDGEEEIKKPSPETVKLQKLGKILKNEISLIGSLILSKADNKALEGLLTTVTANWGNHNDIENTIGPAISAARRDGSFVGSTENFYKVMNLMRTAVRLELLHGFVRALPRPEGLTLNLSNGLELGKYPYKTTIKPTDQGLELSINQFIHVRNKNDDGVVARCELTVTYSFDKNMNLIELKGEPGQIIPEPDTTGTTGTSATTKT